MKNFAKQMLISSLVLFVIFFTNVGFGAAGRGEFLGDVPQMLLLLASVCLFVLGILQCEAQANAVENVDGEKN
ncbi:hypothetical protein [Pararhizobium sp. IMCC21322]|uniref:hypothetical protein n=1 Tax=Pararhizobium sp. IMCC21322 TaxID=3067903 RepID=UPI002741A355|nr:hypothetical protein [Pararhizobium sp. IMCC21322]